jgi:hypothetical protein
MAEEGFKRKPTAILSADVEGYSRHLGEDEEANVVFNRQRKKFLKTERRK